MNTIIYITTYFIEREFQYNGLENLCLYIHFGAYGSEWTARKGGPFVAYWRAIRYERRQTEDNSLEIGVEPISLAIDRFYVIDQSDSSVDSSTDPLDSIAYVV